MSLRLKAVMAVVWIFLLSSFIFFLFFNLVAQRLVTELERESARENLERAVLALRREVEALDAFAEDWASWDDTYEFVQTRNPRYIRVNLVENIFSNLEVNFIVFLDAQNKVVYARGLDYRTGRELRPPSQVFFPVTEKGNLKGITLTEYGLLLLAARPILKSDGTGPPRGTLVFARLLGEEQLSRLSEVTRLSISLRSFRPEEVAGLKPAGQLDSGQVFYYRTVSDTEIESLASVQDIFGHPRLILQVNFPRSAYWIFTVTRGVLEGLLLAAVGTSFVLTWLWFDRTVLSRLAKLTAGVAAIRPESSFCPRTLEVQGKDELALLSREVTRLLQRVEDYQRELAQQKERYQKVVENAAEAIVVAQDYRIKFANRAAAVHTGYPAEELIGLPVAKLVYPEDWPAVEDHYRGFVSRGVPSYGFRYRFVTRDGSVGWVEANSVPIEWEGRPAILHFLSDITPRKILEEELERLNQEKTLILDAIAELVIFLDRDLHVIWANRAAFEVIGADPHFLLGGKCYEVWHGREYPCDGCPVVQAIETGQRCSAEMFFPRTNRYYYINAVPVQDAEGRVVGVVETALNITERKHYEEQLRYLSLHDYLTGLYNRAFFQEEMKRLATSREYPISVLVADMDGLKIINDTLGHAKGDEMLVACAEVLKGSLRRSDILARVGGDEFAALLPRTDERAAEEIAGRIRRAAEKRNAEAGGVPLFLSVGWATCTMAEESLEETFKRADEMMYRHKAANRAESERAIRRRAAALKG